MSFSGIGCGVVFCQISVGECTSYLCGAKKEKGGEIKQDKGKRREEDKRAERGRKE